MRNFFYLLLLAVVLATIALVVRSGIFARQNPGRPINSAMREAMDAKRPQFSAADELLIDKTYGAAHKLPSGLRYVVRAHGTGTTTPQAGQEIIAHYDGRLLDGTRFDSSYASGVPLTFRLGTGAVIKGWDEGFASMKKGEKRTLIIPHWLGYGDRGSPPRIPGKATLIFEVELIDFR
ncbi:MAG: FKBP-type peptidyl-prolyl cis-trans isomerase [Verrucomicrobia bacterium]|nr:FKBP-type peptidyl-prolyl cis-trans isomerase [Verrucomicrobiota bacterium]